ncbi:MAG: WD40 repeat domain-containing protein [Burkholderiales bacterium]|nr:MAG: WD40 repeat domain-containing protein [Burkholderiales bacterium]
MSQPLVSWRKSLAAWLLALMVACLPIWLMGMAMSDKYEGALYVWLFLFYVIAPLGGLWLLRGVAWLAMEASACNDSLLGYMRAWLRDKPAYVGMSRTWWWQRVRAFSQYGADLTIRRAKPHLAMDSFFRGSVLVVGVPVSISAGRGIQVWLGTSLQGTSMARLGPVVALLVMLGLILVLLAWRRVQPARAIRKQWAGRRNSQAIRAYRHFLGGAALYLFVLALVSTMTSGYAALIVGFGVVVILLMGLAHSTVHRLWPRPKGPSPGLWIVLLDGDVKGRKARGWRSELTEAPLGYRYDLPGRVTLMHRVARGWWGPGRGPVTVVAPPGMRLTGEHLTTAWQQGRLRALFPKVLVGLQDWLRTLPPADRWDSLPLRELYPTPDLMLRAVQSLAQAGDTVLLLSQDEAPLTAWRKALALQRVWLGWQGEAFDKTSGLAGLPFEWLVGIDVANHKLIKAYADALLLKITSVEVAEQAPAPIAPEPATSADSQAASSPPSAVEADSASPLADPFASELPPSTPDPSTRPLRWRRMQQQVHEAHQGRILSLQSDLDETMMVSTSRDRTIKLWRPSLSQDPDKPPFMWTPTMTYTGHEAPVVYATFSPDGQYLLSASDDHKVMLWSTQEGRLLSTFDRHQAEVSSVAFSPDGQFVLTGSFDGTACLLRCVNQALELVTVMDQLKAPVNRVLFHPLEETVLTAAGNGMLRLWNFDGQVMRVRESHQAGVGRVAFSPDGQYIASGAGDGSASLWQLGSNRVLTWQNDTSGIISLEFNVDGRRLLSANRRGQIELHHIDGRPEGLIQEGDAQSRSRGLRYAAFAPDGETVLTTTGERLALWQPSIDSTYALVDRWPVVATPTAMLWRGATLAYGTFRGHLVTVGMDELVTPSIAKA